MWDASEYDTALQAVKAYDAGTADALAAEVERERAEGTLQLDYVEQAADVVSCAAKSRQGERYLPLVRHCVAALEQLLGLAGGGGGGGWKTAAYMYAPLLQQLLYDAVLAGEPAVLGALLASRLPLDLVAAPYQQLAPLPLAAVRPNAAACVRLLVRAGVPVTAADLYLAIDRMAPAGVEALLACGPPAVHTNVLTASRKHVEGWSCPIHRVLHQAQEVRPCAWGTLVCLGPVVPAFQRQRLVHTSLPCPPRPSAARAEPSAIEDGL